MAGHHLINLGYSQTHIAAEVEKVFFSRPIVRVGAATLRRFFRRFTGREKRFVVYAGLTDEFARFLQRLGFTMHDRSRLPAEVSTTIDANSNADRLGLVLRYSLDAFDDYGALLAVESILGSIRALTYLAPQGMHCEWGTKIHVKQARANKGFALQKPSLSFDKINSPRMTVGRRLKDIHRYSLRVIGNFDRPSTERLMSSIGTAALARTSSSPENQLISLWSSIEVLLSEPPQNTARIAHYVSLLVPCICLRHIRRQFVALFDELLISYRSRFSKLVRGGPRLVQTDSHTNFAALMLLDEAAPLRTELMGLCAANPLALHRLWKINRDHRTLRDSMKTIRDHERRVDWQLHRIYRARNNLVHAGRMPSYLDSLILNLVEYYRGGMATIVHRAHRDTQPQSDIDQIVAEIGIDYETLPSTSSARPCRTEFQTIMICFDWSAASIDQDRQRNGIAKHIPPPFVIHAGA